MDTPSVGRIVHFVDTPVPGEAPVCLAAIVTAVEGTGVSLGVFRSPAGFFREGCPHDENMSAGSWHWPERV